MNYTQNEKIMSITERTLVIGIDIAKNVQYGVAPTFPTKPTLRHIMDIKRGFYLR